MVVNEGLKNFRAVEFDCCIVTGGKGFVARHLFWKLLESERWIVRIADLVRTISLDENGEQSSILAEALKFGRVVYYGVDVRNKSEFIEEENCWRLCSRATWLKSGDSNSKFFHKVASYNRNKKIIWSIKSNGDGFIRGHEALKDEAVSHFKHLYKATCNHNLLEKCSTASLFPHLVSKDEATELYKPVSLSKLKDILLHFKKERSPRPDGWTT